VFAQAGAMLLNRDFSVTTFGIFLLISLVVGGTMQFYFLGTGRFLQDMGISGKVISGAVAITQVAQALATWYLLDYCLKKWGFKSGLCPVW